MTHLNVVGLNVAALFTEDASHSDTISDFVELLRMLGLLKAIAMVVPLGLPELLEEIF